jgi:hypothetical protein
MNSTDPGLFVAIAAMVEFTAPVFWGFLFLVGLALLILRGRENSLDA